MNPFTEGEAVRCISDYFPKVKEVGNGKIEGKKPKINDVYIIAEILGDYLRFEVLDTDSNNWWHYNRFERAGIQEWIKHININ